MKAEELRIGNTIKINGIVVNIDSRTLFDWNDRRVKEPIPLTTEWLLKFGFEKDEDFGNWHLNDYEIFSIRNDRFRIFSAGVKEGSVHWYNGSSDDYYSSTKKIQYVHQLQNLYYALTGEELTIKK